MESSREVTSLSIEETNRVRAELGLAPLQIDEPPRDGDDDGDDNGGGVGKGKKFTEHGIEIVHQAANNWSEERAAQDIRDKVQVQKRKRELHSTVLAPKTIAEAVDDESIDDWLSKDRLGKPKTDDEPPSTKRKRDSSSSKRSHSRKSTKGLKFSSMFLRTAHS